MYPEPWHLSYAAQSLPAVGRLNHALLADVIEQADILGKQAILRLLPEILEKHVLNVAVPA
jgi:hypothetical protein